MQTERRAKGYSNYYDSLTVPLQPAAEAKEERYADDLETIMRMQSEIKQSVKAEVEAEFPDISIKEKEAELRNRIDMKVLSELFEDEKKSEENKIFKTSYSELADIVAIRYAGLARHKNLIEKMKDGVEQKGEPYLQIDVTHSFPVSAFLKKYLIFEDGKKAVDMSPEEFFKRTGGVIKESGFLNMDYINKNRGLLINVNGEFSKGTRFNGNIEVEALKKIKKYEE